MTTPSAGRKEPFFQDKAWVVFQVLLLTVFIWWSLQNLLLPSLVGLLRGTDTWGHRSQIVGGFLLGTVLQMFLLVHPSCRAEWRPHSSLREVWTWSQTLECISVCGRSSNPDLWLNSVSRDCIMLMQGPWDLPGPWLTLQLERCPWEASAGPVRHPRFNKRSILLPWISSQILPFSVLQCLCAPKVCP